MCYSRPASQLEPAAVGLSEQTRGPDTVQDCVKALLKGLPLS